MQGEHEAGERATTTTKGKERLFEKHHQKPVADTMARTQEQK